jgi:threonine/homoserine/homoserine lactone efflux protein
VVVNNNSKKHMRGQDLCRVQISSQKSISFSPFLSCLVLHLLNPFPCVLCFLSLLPSTASLLSQSCFLSPLERPLRTTSTYFSLLVLLLLLLPLSPPPPNLSCPTTVLLLLYC